MRIGEKAGHLGVIALIVLAWAVFPRTAGASWVGDDILTIEVQSQGLATSQAWLLPQSLSDSGSGCQYSQYDLPGPVDFVSGSTLLGTVDAVSALYKADPFVALGVAVTAGPEGSTFTITSATVAFDSVTNPQAYADVSLTLTDNNGDGASLTGLYPGGNAYEANYTGSSGPVTWTTLEGSFTADPAGENTIKDRDPVVAGSSLLISDTLYSIQSQYSFSLTPYDSASGTSHFEITPEPATLSLLALGALAILRRSRR